MLLLQKEGADSMFLMKTLGEEWNMRKFLEQQCRAFFWNSSLAFLACATAPAVPFFTHVLDL